MKFLPPIFLSLLLCSCSQNQARRNARIKSITESEYDTKQILFCTWKGDLDSRITTTYNQQGNEIKKITKYYFDESKVYVGGSKKWVDITTDTTIYDGRGNKTEERTSDKFGLLRKTVYQYNDKGKETENSTWWGNGARPSAINAYRADRMGNDPTRLYEILNNPNERAAGTLEELEVMHYDAAGNCTAQISYDAAGHMTGRRTWQYDGHNRVIADSTTFFVRKDSVWTIDTATSFFMSYQYDEQGNKTASDNSHFRSHSHFARRYDGHHNIISERKTDDDGSYDNSTTTYEYDSHGNWFKKTFSHKAYEKGHTSYGGTYVTIRDIEYY